MSFYFIFFQYWPPNGQMLHFDDISLFTQEEIEINTGLFLRKIEVRNKETITRIH